MTNNLKAERTLTAEDIERLAISVFDQDSDNDTVPWEQQPGHVRTQTRKQVRQVLTAIRIHFPDFIQSLSTQQPMGEVTATMHKSDTETLFSKGWVPKLLGFSSVPLYALRPNQESGE